jgi:hypothetical protein
VPVHWFSAEDEIVEGEITLIEGISRKCSEPATPRRSSMTALVTVPGHWPDDMWTDGAEEPASSPYRQ